MRSRRTWNMTPLLPDLRSLPTGLVLDGELVAFDNGVPHFPHLTRRLLRGDHSVAVTFVAFDVLHADGHDLIGSRHHARRAVLESLPLKDLHCTTSDTFDDGHALYQGVRTGTRRHRRETLRRRVPARQRGWIKVKNPGYWRRDQDRIAPPLA